jgi:oligopeptidase B
VFNPLGGDTSPSPPLSFAVVTGREDGMPRVWILEFGEEGTHASNDVSQLTVSRMTRLEFDESAYDVGIGGVRDPSLPYVVICYDSLVTPPSHIAVPLHRPSDLSIRKVLKTKDVPGYNKDSYACERTTVRSRDGKTDIPVSLVYHRDVLKERNNGPVPTHLYGYGSYGASIEASFRSTRLPLLNRKMVYALAHVRGGGEMGRPWYDQAKYLTKKNTFNDFVDVARWLASDVTTDDSNMNSIGRGITIPSKLSCEGRSAGGLLVGASLNQHPELFRAAILGVPFVDVACKYARLCISFSANCNYSYDDLLFIILLRRHYD